jgi:hypothetical protein
VAAAYFAAFVGYGVNLEDEGLLLLQIARTARGEVPYVDFHTGYTPGTFYLNALLFRWLGESVIWLRLLLVAVNTASVVLVYVLAAPLAGGLLAAVAALGFAAFLPAFVGDFASFNIPYPAWYAATMFLACQLAVDRLLVTGRRRWAVAAGLAAGIAFGFKPNAGVLAVLALGTTSALGVAGDRNGEGRFARMLLGVALLVLVATFGFRVWRLEFWVIAGPLAALLLLAIRRARGAAVEPGTLGSTIAWAAASLLLVTVPWVAWLMALLGVQGFLRDVLLLGSNAELIYATPYPVPLGFPAGWPVVVAVGLAALGWCGIAAERGRMRAGVALAILVAGALASSGVLLSWAYVPEGLLRSINWQVQHIGFYATPVMFAALTLVLVRWLRADAGPWPLERRRLLAAVVFAQYTYVELYPRVDTMHLIVAMPAALVVAAAVTARLSAAWAHATGVRAATLRGGFAVAGAALAVASVFPQLEGRVAVWRGGGFRLPWSRVPVVLENVRATDLRALDATLDYLDARLGPEEALFAFPALGLVPFALGRPTPTPHDYFFPGRPDHGAEAQILARLAAAPPRYVVTLNRRLGFFSESPAYYFLLRRHVRAQYRLAARFGRYDVMARRDLPEEPLVEPAITPPPLPGGLEARLSDPDREQRRVAIFEVLDRLDAGVPLETIAPGRREQLLVMRNIAEVGDGRGLWPAWQTFNAGTWRVKNEAGGALNFIALNYQLGRYLWAPDAAARTQRPPPHLDEVDEAYLQKVLLERSLRMRLGVFAAWVLTQRRDASAAPGFQALVEEIEHPYFRLAGNQGLHAIGRQDALEALVGLLALREHATQNLIPSYLLGLGPEERAAVARALATGLGSDEALEREVSAWVAGDGGFVEVLPALRAARTDGAPEVRNAAGWAQERLERGGTQ